MTTPSGAFISFAASNGVTSEIFKNEFEKDINTYKTFIQTVKPSNNSCYEPLIFLPGRMSDVLIPDYIVSSNPLTMMTLNINSVTIATIPLKFINEIDGFNTGKINGMYTYKLNWERYISAYGLRLIAMGKSQYKFIIKKEKYGVSYNANYCRLYCKNLIIRNEIRMSMVSNPIADTFKTIYSERVILHSGQNKIKFNMYEKSCIKGIYIEGYNKNINEIIFKHESTIMVTVPKKINNNIIELQSINQVINKKFELEINNNSEESKVIMVRIFLEKTLVYDRGMVNVFQYSSLEH